MSQKNATPGLDLWQISVLCDVGKKSTFILTVTKDCYTAELFEKLREHPKAPQTDGFQLYSIGGTIRSCLVESWEERLSDYDITDRSTLGLVAILTGGVWPTRIEVETEPRLLRPADGITLTTISDEHPDVLGLECDGPGVIMGCGHATAPMPLALYCLTELEKGKDEILCPECDVKWKFALLKPAACLTPNEVTEFEQRAHINYFRRHQTEMNTCPRCSTFSRPRRAEDKRVVCQNCTSRFGKRFEFCWTCLGEWKTSGNETCGNSNCGSNKRMCEILASCETKELNGIEVPSKRACPNCAFIIHHEDGCKHMTCTYCSYEFCFICLKKYPCETDVYDPCDVAPRQTSDTNFSNVSVDAVESLSSSEESSGESENDLDEQTDEELLETPTTLQADTNVDTDEEELTYPGDVLDFLDALADSLGRLPDLVEAFMEMLVASRQDAAVYNMLLKAFDYDFIDALLEMPAASQNREATVFYNMLVSAGADDFVRAFMEMPAASRDREATVFYNMLFNAHADLSSRPDDVASSTDIVQPTKTLETEEVQSSTTNEISRPEEKSSCIII